MITKKFLLILTIVGILMGLVGCGQSGALYLPTKPQPTNNEK